MFVYYLNSIFNFDYILIRDIEIIVNNVYNYILRVAFIHYILHFFVLNLFDDISNCIRIFDINVI